MSSSEVGPFVSKIRTVINDIGKHEFFFQHADSNLKCQILEVTVVFMCSFLSNSYIIM